jgi:hypothetical protein
MSKEQKQSKQARKMEVKTLVPWMIIVLIVVAFVGMVIGWSLRSDQVSQIKAEVAEQVGVVKAKKQ